MGKFDGFLLASDFDGTLASSDGSISKENSDAVKYFISEGGYFTVCTGRSKQGFHAFSPEIMNAPLILANGAMIYDFINSKTVSYCGINAGIVNLLEDVSGKFPFLCVEMYSSECNSFVYNLCEESRKHFERQFIRYCEVGSFSAAEFPLVKIMLYVGKNNTEKVQKYLRQTDMYCTKFIPTYGDFIEILHKNTDKGTAVLRLAEKYGIEKKFVFTVGDGSNDVDMLKAAAVGFVPENGDILAKEAGDVIVKSNDEGSIADVISKLEKMYC